MIRQAGSLALGSVYIGAMISKWERRKEGKKNCSFLPSHSPRQLTLLPSSQIVVPRPKHAHENQTSELTCRLHPEWY